MSIILKYIDISLKKNFTYRANGIMVIIDTLLSCFSVWLFWNSLIELEITIPGWDKMAVQSFIGFCLISKAVANLMVGDYDIERHITEGTLDNILVKPVNPVVMIMLERPDFLQFAVMFGAGVFFVFRYCPTMQIGRIIIAILVCIIATTTLFLVEVMLFILAFWLKRVDSLADIYVSICSIRDYPLVFLGKKMLFFFTYVMPVVCVGTVPTYFLKGTNELTAMGALSVIFCLNIGMTVLLWKTGRRHYESTN